MDSLIISTKRIIQWMNVIREESESRRYRLLENFWASQLRSKSWLINTVKEYFPDTKGNVYVFGGWYGVLSQLLVDNLSIDKVYSIDIDYECEVFGKRLSEDDTRIIFVTGDMKDVSSYTNVGLIINTSTEHVNQETYDTWLNNLPINIPIVVQGNNFFSCDEHIRCYNTLEEFNQNNGLKDIVYSGVLDCVQFQRFMTIGYKNE